MDLESIESIRQLKYRYFRTLDLKDWEAFGQCLTEDVKARYGTHTMGEPLHYDSREGVLEFMRSSVGPQVITVHVAHHPEITVDGDGAQASWCFEDTVIALNYGVHIRGAGYYHDTYRREADGQWRIASTEYERIYEAMTKLEDTPSFQLLANRWDPDLAH